MTALDARIGGWDCPVVVVDDRDRFEALGRCVDAVATFVVTGGGGGTDTPTRKVAAAWCAGKDVGTW